MKWLLLVVYLLLPTAYAEPLTIGTSAEDPPFSSYADKRNHFYGFEIELMMEICKRIDAECRFRTVIASQMLREIRAGKINLAMAAIIIPSAIDEEESQLLFSLPYLPSSAQFITKYQSDINTIKELRNKRVGVRLGTLFHGTMFRDYVRNIYNFQVNTVLYLTMNDLLNALMHDEVDAVLSNAEPMKYWYMNNSKVLKLIGRPIPIGNGYAVMGKVGQEVLMAKINEAIIKIEEDGTYETIYNRYFNL